MSMVDTCRCSPLVKALGCHVHENVNVLRSRGLKLSLRASAYPRIISNNSYSYAHDERGDNPEHERVRRCPI